MARLSILLMPDTGGQESVTGDKHKAAGFFGFNQGYHTVAIHLNNYRGKVYIEGSLTTEPTSDDWFAIQVVSGQDFVQYPADPLNPTGTPGEGDDGVDHYTFQGNFVWLRARVVLDNVVQVTNVVTKILLNF